MKNKNGIHVPLIGRAEAIADYLEKEHWRNPSGSEQPDLNPIYLPSGADESDFSHDELKYALKMAKANKQPGPDGIIMELLKWLNHQNREKC